MYHGPEGLRSDNKIMVVDALRLSYPGHSAGMSTSLANATLHFFKGQEQIMLNVQHDNTVNSVQITQDYLCHYEYEENDGCQTRKNAKINTLINICLRLADCFNKAIMTDNNPMI